MNSGLMLFAVGVVGIAAAAAVVAPGASEPPATTQADLRPAPVAAQEPKPRKAAPRPGGMISHSYSSGPVIYGKPMRPPPIVVIPASPGQPT